MEKSRITRGSLFIFFKPVIIIKQLPRIRIMLTKTKTTKKNEKMPKMNDILDVCKRIVETEQLTDTDFEVLQKWTQVKMGRTMLHWILQSTKVAIALKGIVKQLRDVAEQRIRRIDILKLIGVWKYHLNIVNRTIVPSVLLFSSGSAAPARPLSNLWKLSVALIWKGFKFSSVEAAYQATKFPKDMAMFAIGGKLESWGMELYYSQGKVVKSQTYWIDLNCCILPKLAQNNHKKFGLLPPVKLTMAEKNAVFRALHKQKFAEGSYLARVLLETGNITLLEQCRGALQRELSDRKPPERWGGLVKDTPDNQKEIVGCNVMGKMLMARRNALRQPPHT